MTCASHKLDQQLLPTVKIDCFLAYHIDEHGLDELNNLKGTSQTIIALIDSLPLLSTTRKFVDRPAGRRKKQREIPKRKRYHDG